MEVIANPTDVWAVAGLIGDIIDLIPFVAGVGESVKVIKVSVKVSDGLGDLTNAGKYGIKSYSLLRQLLKGTGLHAHHIVEKRLVQYMGINMEDMLSVAVTAAEHQRFTNAWRKIFPYGTTNYSTLRRIDIWEAAQNIYTNYPDILEVAERILFGLEG